MVSVAAAGLMVTVTVPVLVLTGLLESTTVTWMGVTPPPVGVPVMVQLLLSVRPGCSVPLLSVQV